MSLYLATCQDCTPVLPQPFTDFRERAAWTEAHRAGTGHTVTYSTGQGYRADREAAGPEPSGSVPVPVLEALAGAWLLEAVSIDASAARAAERGALPERTESMAATAKTLADCAAMLREAITETAPKGEQR